MEDDIKRILQNKQFHLQLKSEQKEIIQNVLERKDSIRVITKLPNSVQSYKGKVKTHKYINRQNQSTTGKLCKP